MNDVRDRVYARMSREELLAELGALRAGEGKAAEHARLVHALRSHQLELEAQNQELRDTQEALEASRARFADLYELAPVAYFTFDALGCVLDVNRRGAEMLAMDRRVILGAPFVAMVRVDPSSAFLSLLLQCFADHRRADGELCLSMHDGAPPVTVQACAEPVFRAADRVASCRMALVDVSALKTAEAEARRALEAERRLRDRVAAITGAHVAVSAAIADRAGLAHILQTVVDYARTLVGAEYAALGIEGEHGEPFQLWAQSGMSEAQARALGRPPGPVGVLGLAAHSAVRLRDLREHPCFRGFPAGHPPMRSLLGVPVHRLGRPIGTLYATNKIGADEFTEDDARLLDLLGSRVAATLEIARLREAEAEVHSRLRAVLQQMPEAVVLVGEDPSGGPSFNAAAEALFGVPADHRVDAEVLTPAGWRLQEDELPHVRASYGETVDGLELCVRRPDGTQVPVVASAAPVSDGRPGMAVAVYRDVSAEKQLEKEREAWTGIVAHDLRQPTCVISFSAQLLARFGGLGPRDAKSIDRIANAARTLSRMIDDLLDVTMIDARRLKLVRTSVDVVALVKEVVDRCRPAYEGRAVTVRAIEEPAFVLADPERLGQVVTNLLSNGVKYSPDGSEIGVRVVREREVVTVAVENRGDGLTVEEMDRVFQRFYRTRTAQGSALGGLGLGLYICKGIIEAHGGQMGVESVPGQTTSFWFRLPERREDAGRGG